jgi:DNA primase
VTVRRRAVARRLTELQGVLTRLGHSDPAQSAAIQNEMMILTRYDRALQDEGPSAL